MKNFTFPIQWRAYLFALLNLSSRLLYSFRYVVGCACAVSIGIDIRCAHCRRLVPPVRWLLVICVCFPSISHASSPPANDVHICKVLDYEDMRARDSLYAATKQALNLNVGEPRTVRMIYFLPNDRPFQQEVVDSMKVAIRNIQTFYGEQMQAHEYGDKTFRFETDAQDEPVVHRVDGQHPDSDYSANPLNIILEEIGQVFDLQANIYVVVSDNSGGLTAQGGSKGKIGGFAAMAASLYFISWNDAATHIMTHELGHAFGLGHDFRDYAYIMSYGGLGLSQSQLSACHAKFLAVHPYFNSDIPIEETSPSTIKLISPREYSVGSENVSIQLEVSDSDGLYQVLLIAYFLDSPDMVACRGVMGKKNTVATFDYDGFFSSVGFRTVRGLPEHSFRVLAVDVAGNISSYFFRLSEDASELPTIMKVSGDGQQDRPGAMLAHPLVVEVRDHSGNLLPNAQVTFTVTTGEGKLSGRFSIEQTTTDANGRAESMLTLGPNPGVNIVEVTIAGREPVTFNVEGVGTPTTPSVDGDLQKWHLPDGAIVRLGKGLLGESDRPVAFSPDGQRFAVASGIGVWLYEVTTSRALALLPTVSRVTSVAFSPDGTMLASGSNVGDIELWDVATGTYIAAFGHWVEGLETTSVSFSLDGTMLASGSDDGTVKLWDVATRTDIATLEEGVTTGSYTARVISVSFSPDGTMLAAGGLYGTVRLWDVATGTDIATFEYPFGVTSVSFSPDGKTLAFGSEDGKVRLWDVVTRENIATLSGHNIWVVSVSFSPDGTTLAVGSFHEVKLWDVATGTDIATFEYPFEVTSVAFSPDGATLALGSVDGTVKLWNRETGNVVPFLSGHQHVGRSVSFSPDGTMLASGASDATVKLWDVETGRISTSFGPNLQEIDIVAFSPDGTTIASGWFGSDFNLWDVATGTNTVLSTIENGIGLGQPLSFSFSYDGILASGHRRGIVLWDVATGTQITTFPSNWAQSVVFSPDGTTLASGSGDGTVLLWDVVGKKNIATLFGHTGRVNSLSFSPDGTTLASGSGDDTVRLWDVVTGENIAVLAGYIGWGVYSVVFSPDGTTLASGEGEGKILLWDVVTGENIAVLAGYIGWGNLVNSVSFSPDGTTLASGAEDGTVLLWDTSKWMRPRPAALLKVSGDNQQGTAGAALTSPLVVELRDQYGSALQGVPVTFTVTEGSGKLGGRFTVENTVTDANGRAQTALTLGPSPGTNTVEVSFAGSNPLTFNAVGVGTNTIPVIGDNYQKWHLPDGAIVRLGKGAIGESDRTVSFSPDGQRLAVASGIGVWLYDVATYHPLVLLPSERAVHSTVFSPDGMLLASGLNNGKIELWMVETGTKIATLEGHGYSRITSVVFSPDGALLASGSWDQIIKLWDVTKREVVGTWKVERNDNFVAATPVSFSPDGTMLASGFQDGTVRLWDVATQKQVATLEGHTDWIKSVSFSPDGATLASVGSYNDQIVRLWDVATRRTIGTLEHQGWVGAVSFSPDGRTLASGSSSEVRLWDVATRRTIGTLEHQGWVDAVSFSPDGRTLASGSSSEVRLWDVEMENIVIFPEYMTFDYVAFSHNFTTLASTSRGYGDPVRLWDVATRRTIAILDTDRNERVNSVSFSPDGTMLASGSDDGVKLWDIATRRTIATLKDLHRAVAVVSVSFSPDGRILASRSSSEVRLWDVATRRTIGTLEHQGWVGAVSFSPDGRTLASTSRGYGDPVRLWDVATRRTIAILDTDRNERVNSVSFSPDGTMLASGSNDGVKLWDVATRRTIATLEHQSSVESVSFSPDGTILASGTSHISEDVTLWDIATRTKIATLEGHASTVFSVSFSPDGTILASGSNDGTVLLWDMEKLTQPQPQTLVKVSGDKQEGVPSAPLANPLIVEVKDQNGNVLEGVAVTFSVTEGDGTLSVKTAMTDSSGHAQTVLTLGNSLGTTIVAVTVAGIEQPVTFVIKVIATPDFDGDGTVGFPDFLLFVEQFGFSREDEAYQARFDLDGDGMIGFSDFLIFVNSFGKKVS